jgi:hypothetical protein
MQKLVLLSVVIALIVFPLVAAGDPRPKRGLKRVLASVLAFNLFYIFLLSVVVPRLGSSS